MPYEFIRIKHPRTYHLPWSPGFTGDDLRLADTRAFNYQEVVVTEKMDGENITLYPDGTYHARSLDSGYHESRTWLARWHTQEIAPSMPEDFRICGEYMRATHAIYYDNLPAYFLVHSIWQLNDCLSWTDTMLYCELMGLKTVPVFFVGEYNEKFLRERLLAAEGDHEIEGYVVRLHRQFSYDDYGRSVAKYVRAGHVPPGTPHWSRGPLRLNRLRERGIF